MKRILIVDDELAILEVLRDILETEGYQVETARNGAEGLERLAAVHPDLLLLDLMMPVMDGRTMLDRMERDDSLDGLPVVLMSAGRLRQEERERAKRFLPKPFELDSLLGVVTESIGAA